MVSLRSDSFPRYVSRCLTNVGSPPNKRQTEVFGVSLRIFFFFNTELQGLNFFIFKVPSLYVLLYYLLRNKGLGIFICSGVLDGREKRN